MAYIIIDSIIENVSFLIQAKSTSPNKLVHKMATHLSYPHVNLGYVGLTVAEVVKHS